MVKLGALVGGRIDHEWTVPAHGWTSRFKRPEVSVGTISSLMDRLRRAREDSRPSVAVTQFGFSVGSAVVVWQLVSEIRAFKADRLTTDEAFLEFRMADQIIRVSEEQPGFAALEGAMCAAFPATATWRSAVLMPSFAQNPTLLFRRGGDQGKG